jgi:hypothetical protein
MRIGVRGQQLRDAEIEQLGCAVGSDENIAALQIVMNNQVAMSMRPGLSNSQMRRQRS